MSELSNVAQLTGLDALSLISLIGKAANNARMHKKNCRQFAQHLKLIANLLQQLNVSEMKERSETAEPLERLEETLRKGYVLVNSCENKSYFYLLALGWTIVHQFKQTQAEIDSFLRLIPLITLVEHNRDRLHAIEKDEKEYTMDAEDAKLQQTILKSECSESDNKVLKLSLSRTYPGLSFNEALQKENEKLRIELEYMRVQMDVDKCDVIEHLIGVTKSACDVPQGKNNMKHSLVQDDSDSYVDSDNHKQVESECGYVEPSGKKIALYREQDMAYSSNGQKGQSYYALPRWRNRIYHFYKDPDLCLSTFRYPCGIFANIATFVSDGRVTQGKALKNCLILSLVLSCFCYTCCVRRKLRKRLNIPNFEFTTGYLQLQVFCIHYCCELSDTSYVSDFSILLANGKFMFFSCLSSLHIMALELTFLWENNLATTSAKSLCICQSQGGSCDDYWAHALCFPCALIQEWSEVIAYKEQGDKAGKMMAPTQQFMHR